LAGEAKIPFISVSGAQFQEKYVGVGSSRIRELFKLASDSCPVIVFIDEIDALGRARSGDGESSSSERDNTLNELLVAMDGFGSKDGIFVVGATNRADLLDPALIRPGRIDKRIYIGNPDAKTRQCVIAVHIDGKPYEDQLDLSSLVENTNGLSGAQIENLLNEAMLTAIRENREEITQDDIDVVLNKMMVGWQPTEHEFTSDIIDHIAIHEMGHAIVGIMSKHHSKVTKVMINLNAPQSPGYTVFETTSTPIYTREALFEHLMILLGGRVAEEVFYQTSVTTGAINDFEEALKLAEKMITYYGMGSKLIYPKNSEKYKNIVDEEVFNLIEEAYTQTEQMMNDMKVFVKEASEVLKDKQLVTRGELLEILARVAPDTVDMTSFMELE
jgi:cell division protease FtsH